MGGQQSDNPHGTESVKVGRRPRYSVLLTNRNEGERLKKTVDDVIRHAPLAETEFVIIDDASEDNSTAFLTEAGYADLPLRYVRNDRRRGLIYNRALSAELAHGEYLAFLDAHCGVSSGWLEVLSSRLESVNGKGLIVPTVYNLRSDWTIDLNSHGATGCTVYSPFWEFGSTIPWQIDGHTCTCTILGMAWMCRRDWYQHIGGLDRSMLIWGLENIDVPLRTWAAGGWCLVAEDVQVGHLYNERPTLRMDDVDYVYNKIRAAHNVLTPATFQKAMRVLIHLAGFPAAIKRIYDERYTLTAAKDRFETIRERSDDWIIDTFELPILESPTFHLAPRRPALDSQADAVSRPSVAVIVPVNKHTVDLDALLSSLLLNRTYARFYILLAVSNDVADDVAARITGQWQHHSRITVVNNSKSLDVISDRFKRSEFFALFPANAIAVDEFWIEEFLLLAEHHPRMLMACPRTCWQCDNDGELLNETTFEHYWDWKTPSFFRERTGQPASEVPYHIMSCPATLVFVRRDALEYLGGWEAAEVASGRFPITDLAIHGWLAGLEVFCHPQISVTCQRLLPHRSWPTDPAFAYQCLLPAVKYFTSCRRERCQQELPSAEPLLDQHAERIAEFRREFLARARFDDDWLFFKFNINDRCDGPVISHRNPD